MMSCSVCNDTGWKYVGPPEARRVARCECRAARQAERLLHLACIPKRYQHCELSNYEVEAQPVKYQRSILKAKLAAEKFVQQYPKDTHGFLFVGGIGVGKTHLAVAIIQELIRKNVRCLFRDYRELLREIQDSYNPSVEATEMQVLRPVFEAEVLVIDELGAIRKGDWVWDTVSLILNTRYNRDLTTILTTNFPDLPEREKPSGDVTSYAAAKHASSSETLGDRITERMRSRLHEMCRVVEIEGEDFRLRFKKASLHEL
ncbi:MAG: ATP-binding protein [Terriglobales bacterium]